MVGMAGAAGGAAAAAVEGAAATAAPVADAAARAAAPAAPPAAGRWCASALCFRGRMDGGIMRAGIAPCASKARASAYRAIFFCSAVSGATVDMPVWPLEPTAAAAAADAAEPPA